jgi:hypothetical protein
VLYQPIAGVSDVLLNRPTSAGSISRGDKFEDLGMFATRLSRAVHACAASPQANVALSAGSELFAELERRLCARRLIQHLVEPGV